MGREKQSSAKQPVAAASQALLDAFAAASDAEAAHLIHDNIKQYLRPILACTTRGRAGKLGDAQLPSKAYCTFSVQLLRISMARLSSDIVPAVRDMSMQLATLGLQALTTLRAFLKGRPHEVEILRYTLVRKLVLLTCFSSALHQSWLIYCALCCQCWQARSDVPCNTEPAQLPPAPFPATSLDNDVVSLFTGTVLNMLLSFSEQKDTRTQVSKLVHVTANLKAMTAWLRYAHFCMLNTVSISIGRSSTATCLLQHAARARQP